MLKNYVKIAWRNLLKNRTLSIINIAGLSFSVAFCLLVVFYIRDEQSYDQFHEKKDRLFRVEMSTTAPSPSQKNDHHLFSFLDKSYDTHNRLVFPLTVGPDMQRTFPEIKSITRFQGQGNELVKVDDHVYKQDNIVAADYSFFSNFSFHFKKGNAKSAFSTPKNVVIAESIAKKYFGKQDPIGKIISFVGSTPQLFTVAGVVEDAPANSSIQYTIVVPLMADPDYKERIDSKFNQSSHLLVVELANGVSMTQFENKMNAWIQKYYIESQLTEYPQYNKREDFKDLRWYLRPLADCHYNISAPWGHYTNVNNIYQLACLVIIILLIAALNYILIVISNAAARSQEVGIRKVMGAGRRSVVLQFWTETQITVIIAVIIGLAFTQPLLPLFNKMIIPVIVLLCFALGLLAGYYPALVISKMKPLSIIKGFSTFKINPRFSKVLIVLQYTCCVILMISAFIINRQMLYINNKDLGFNKDQVLLVKNPTWDGDFSRNVNSRLSVFAQSQPSVKQYASMAGALTGNYNHNAFKLNGEQKWLCQFAVDYNYFDMLGVKFMQGRPFSREIISDTSKKIRPSVINETLFKLLGKDAKLGVYNEAIRSTIIGVVADYHFESLSKKIEPQQHVLTSAYAEYFMLKVKGGQIQPTIAGIEKEWKNITGNYPFEYTFLDQSIATMYQPEMRWQKTIQAACFFAIFIACMGLFGLSAINAINRMKEIGIRKILGASIKDIVATLSGDFILLVSLSIIIATPLAWWIMNKWLEDFAYRIQISWWMFVVVGCVAIVIALLTTSFQAVKAALANPVDSLRNE